MEATRVPVRMSRDGNVVGAFQPRLVPCVAEPPEKTHPPLDDPSDCRLEVRILSSSLALQLVDFTWGASSFPQRLASTAVQVFGSCLQERRIVMEVAQPAIAGLT